KNFAAAAEGHAGRCADDRERRVLQRLEKRLAMLHEFLDPGPMRDVYGEERKPEICAERKMLSVISDDETFEALADDGNRLTDHRQRACVERVHLRMEFEAGDTVADVP